ncbi:uncharacterized protein HMPREF1541_07356 [Cyphellophora europaea CBS 101466]|uniref:Uncharacterized protein n=1 Tax=Cyphellophora europaea (strain CBS 101466) TaxID=1220924 RepID=W2RPV0_CYPE1|nr:uncharacterized protein HMPREF1541_07356 [Cyphellophora europaea CBS 101466]ETN37733.1 hypothetical protein HMPREF1541_07356 [Cyphellophora europaea CBS 101466]
MATDIDLRVISNFSSVPEVALTSLLSSPTIDAVKSLLEAVEKNARECEQNKSHKVKLEVELETVVRTNESKVKVLQASRDKALADAQKLRGDLQASETNRSKVESDLDQLRTTASSEASETTTLKARIASLESSNRDTITLLESKTTAYEKLSQDLSAQHQKAGELRKQVASLEQAAQASNSAAASANFRQQSLQQEIDLLKKNNEWLENERKVKADEHTTFRKEKNARLAELSRANEQYIADAEALKRSEVALKHRLDEYTNKYEDAVQELQKLREEKASEADSFRVDIESAQRLAELQQANADRQKQRAQELAADLEEAREEAANQLGDIRAAAEADHEEKEAAIRKIAELEANIAQLQSDIEQDRTRPSTPQPSANGNAISTPMRPSTPLGIFSPMSRGTKSATQTQMYTEYKRIEKELAKEKHTNAMLHAQLEEMATELEQSKPEIDELRSDYVKREQESIEMSSLLEVAEKEKDEAMRSARVYHGQLEARIKEVEVLQQQLRDHSSQIRRLVMEIEIRNAGGQISDQEWAELQAHNEESAQAEMEGLSETQRVVNERLIAFKNVSELQQQNQDQLATIRNLVSQLESQESNDRQEKFNSMEQELASARAQIAGFQDEIKTMVAQSKSFVKERDMFRNMLTRKGHVADITDFSRSLPVPPAGSPGNSNSAHGGESDLVNAIKQLQQQYDSHRQETVVDQSALKSQVDDLSRRNSELQTQASRLQGQLSAATQRAEMLQSNYDMLKTENSELQKRSYAAMENATKQEMRVQQTAEDLVETKGLVDSLQRDSANLKAEKELWKTVEKRLLEDNESLRNERGRLDSLNSSLQGILNEREQADSETRRRLQSQAESLESELHSTKRKLNDEQEENRKSALRRQYEQEQSQKRIDDLMTTLGSLREELAAAKTSRDHLQARVDEMTVELRGAEERLEVYTKPASQPSNENGEEDVMSKEQELTLEVSELKRELDLTKSELDRVNEQIDVYKNISQTAEERLQELGETNDQYREETEATLSEKDTRIKDLEQRIEDTSTELEKTNTELSKLRDEQQDVDRRLEQQKTFFEGEVERLKESEERAVEQAQFNLDLLKKQADIANEKQQNYENELVAHGKTMDNLKELRGESSQLRLEAADLKTQAETAQTTLQQKEASWSEQKDRYEQELADLKKRREEVAQQNSLLHGQLETLTQQISALQRDRTAITESASVTEVDSDESKKNSLEDLQEVIKYLRREKEIVDVQYHLGQQDAKRIRQQLDFTQKQLDETRLKLDQQRRSEADSERNAMSHSKLMEQLNDLQVYRESSVTLRAEAKQASQALGERTKQVEELTAQIQPLRARVAELENLVETRDGELKILQNDRDHWRQRTQDILSKYNRIDPAELEGMKEQLTNLEKERDDALAARDDLQAQIDTIPEQIKTAKDQQKTALTDQFKGAMKARVDKKQSEVDTVTAEKNTLQQELDVVREQLESARNYVPNSQDNQVNGDPAQNPGEVDLGTDARITELEADIAEKDQHIASLKSEKESAVNEKESAVKAKEDQMKAHLTKKFNEFKEAAQKAKETALQELRTSLETTHQQELEKLRIELASSPDARESDAKPHTVPVGESSDPPQAAPSTEITDDLLMSIPAERYRWGVQNIPYLKEIVTRSVKSRVEKEVAQLKASGQFADNAAAQSTSADVTTVISQKQAEFDAEKEALEKRYEERLEQEKQELIAQHEEALENQKLGFSEEAAKKIEEQVKNAEAIAAKETERLVANATTMAEKKSSVKLNMATNRANVALAKIQVVQTAAAETPQRAVSEVWEEAKVAKPAPAARPAAPPADAPATPAPAQDSSEESKESAVANEVSKDPVDAETAEETKPEANQAPPSAPAQTAPALPAPNGPAKASVGTGPGAQRNISGLPRGASSIARGRGASQIARGGTGIPRGTQRGGGRGGARSVSMGGAGGRGGAASSPTRGGLNPGAQGFVPGAKRAREDGDGADGGQKRLRGGGQGS